MLYVFPQLVDLPAAADAALGRGAEREPVDRRRAAELRHRPGGRRPRSVVDVAASGRRHLSLRIPCRNAPWPNDPPDPSKPRDHSTWVADHPGVQVERMAAPDGTDDDRRAAACRLPVHRRRHRGRHRGGAAGGRQPTTSSMSRRSAASAATSSMHCATTITVVRLDPPLMGRRREPTTTAIRTAPTRVTRRTDDGDLIDRTVLLLAGFRQEDRSSVGGEVGLRIVMHLVARRAPTRFAVRVTGLTLSNLPVGAGRARRRNGAVETCKS